MSFNISFLYMVMIASEVHSQKSSKPFLRKKTKWYEWQYNNHKSNIFYKYTYAMWSLEIVSLNI